MAVPEISARYVLTPPSGSGNQAVFNDPSDPNYVGMLTEVTGLDSPDVRESADDLVQMDGGLHGDFFYGRRPITMTGLVLNPTSPLDRSLRVDRLTKASDAMRGDAKLTWNAPDGTSRFVNVRRQQPLRITGTYQKQFQVALVAADPRIYNSTLGYYNLALGSSAATAGRTYGKTYDMKYAALAPLGQQIVTNNGTMTTYPVFTVTGPGNNPVITNNTTSQQIRLNYSLGTGDTLTIDMLNRTVVLNGTASRYGSVDFLNTDWFGLVPGNNDLRFSFDTYTVGSKFEVFYRDAWL